MVKGETRHRVPGVRIDRAKLKCSFCGRGLDDVRTLFKGLGDYETAPHICDECIDQCRNKLEENRAQQPS